ncbi:MAG TPA: N4-gp56 family major capsid protein [Candidatus Limiplasma sp.]|nr:N4-gp56 family major capsid protein [Candidatus Limiplasma sp.]HPS80806.1 N4-gp56 family major capsid protein [Candidatus Limiplasma sp.]
MKTQMILPMIDIEAGFAPSIRLNLRLFDDVLNKSTNPELSDGMKTYYHQRLLDFAEPELLYDRYAASYPIPSGSGKTIEFRYFDPLPKALTPIVEGVVPIGSKLSMHSLTASIQQYGDFVPYTDLVSATLMDPVVERATVELGSQAGRTLDTISREVVCGGTNKMFAPQVVSDVETEVLLRANVNANCLFTPSVIRKAVNILKRNNAKKINALYPCIIHPDTIADMMGNKEWLEAQKYVNPDKIYNGSIGKLYDAGFMESTEAKIIGPEYFFGSAGNGVCRMSLKTALDATGSTSIFTNEAITVAQAAELTAKIAAGTVKMYVGGNEATLVSVTAGDPGTAKFVVTAAVKSVAANAMICGYGAGRDGSAIYCTVFLAMNAYGTTEVSNMGLQHVVKPLGYKDALNLVGSVGWKATKVTERLIEAYMVRVEHTTSMGLVAESN